MPTDHAEGVIEPIEVTTEWMRSEPAEVPCLCCAGPDYRGHVFCYTTRTEDGDPHRLHDWTSRALRSAPEGARIRFSVEMVAPS